MVESSTTVVGILGLGRMGSVIARHIAAAGFRVQAYDPVAREEDFGPAGVELRSSEGGAVEGADVVLLIVGYDEEVKDIVSAPGFQASCRPGQVVAVMSTVRPSTMAEIAAALPAGVAAVDVPVCRGQVAADEGRLLALLGGAEADVQRCLPVLRAFCTDMEHVGDLGTGQVAKMANNVMLWSAYFGVFEAMQLMRGAGVDAEQARQALRSSSADSWALSMWPNVRPVWAHDDLAIAKQVAAAVGVEVPVLSAVSEAFGRWPNPEEVYESRSQVH